MPVETLYLEDSCLVCGRGKYIRLFAPKVCQPKYKVGEVVAVAQTYKDVRNGGYPVDSRYDAFREADWGIGENGALRGTAGENNKMFVRAELMPHQIRITNVRVERLQDITDEDCLREGIYSHTVELDEIPGVHPRTDYAYQARIGRNIPRWWFPEPKLAFAALVDKISGKGTWESNPLVYVYEFELVK
jgi:hypothetical protein